MQTIPYSISPSIYDWLVETDPENPSIRFFTFKNILGKNPDAEVVRMAGEKIMETGPVPAILAHQHPDGYWEDPGPGYRPKYTSTVWSLIMLSQLGAHKNHPQVQQACKYVLENARTSDGYFSINRNQSGCVHCLQGNLSAALIDLGQLESHRLQEAIGWMACSVTGEGFYSSHERDHCPHYICSGISGPGFLCSANDHQPCAWGAVKVGLALSKIPMSQRSLSVNNAIDRCLEFLLSVDPVSADYPHPFAPKPSTSWFKFGFPMFYVTDLLQNLEVLLALGLKGDRRLEKAIAFIEKQQDKDGKWYMTYTYNGKTWVHIEEKKQPSKWITYRALSVLKGFYG